METTTMKPTVKEVLQAAGDTIGGFPISPAKVKRAGFEPAEFLLNLTTDLKECPDLEDSKIARELIAAQAELQNSHSKPSCPSPSDDRIQTGATKMTTKKKKKPVKKFRRPDKAKAKAKAKVKAKAKAGAKAKAKATKYDTGFAKPKGYKKGSLSKSLQRMFKKNPDASFEDGLKVAKAALPTTKYNRAHHRKYAERFSK